LRRSLSKQTITMISKPVMIRCQNAFTFSRLAPLVIVVRMKEPSKGPWIEPTAPKRLVHQSRFGRYLFAIGSNAEAARLSGVNTVRMICIAYTLSAVCAAFVGILLAMRIGIGNATQAEGWELQAIASSVIGGTSLFGAGGWRRKGAVDIGRQSSSRVALRTSSPVRKYL
jgi:hypothetical protein